MDAEEFRARGKEIVDYIANYVTNIDKYHVSSDVEPGYLRPLLPKEAPMAPEGFDKIMEDFNKTIMPGITHWQHPHFFAYFPSGSSYPAILADMLSDAIGSIAFSWAASPAVTELETVVLDWFGRAIGLPENFLHSGKDSNGGGVIQSSASECVLVSMLSARNQAIHLLKKELKSDIEDSVFLPKLVAYCSKEAHSCVEKAAKILLVRLRILETDNEGVLPGETLQKAIDEDKSRGLVPFFFCAILGSTSSCSFDNLEEIGPIIKREPKMWFHVDAAYAGSAFICPELRHYLKGIELADSFNTNPNKWLLTCFDCSCLWVKCKYRLTHALAVDPLYLQHNKDEEVVDFRHWTIQLSRRFRALKLWFVFRTYGLSKLQEYQRNHMKLAKYFEELVKTDSRFEVVNNVRLGLVCFRLIGTDILNRDYMTRINASREIFMTPAMIRGKYIIRFALCSEYAKKEDVDFAWDKLREFAAELLEKPALPRQVGMMRPPLQRQESKRLSFTRSVSKELYKRSKSRSNLQDGATPILVADSDEEENGVVDPDELLRMFAESTVLTNDTHDEKHVQ